MGSKNIFLQTFTFFFLVMCIQFYYTFSGRLVKNFQQLRLAQDFISAVIVIIFFFQGILLYIATCVLAVNL